MKGFTLIELIFVVAILSILALIGVNFMQEGFNTYFTTRNINNANWQGRLALENMARRILAIRSPSDILIASSNDFKFVDNNANTTEYTLSSSALQLTVNGTAQTLGDGVNSLSFSYYDRNLNALASPVSTPSNIRYVQIDLIVTLNNANYSFRTVVAPRNLP